jgi:hypothetical protein
MGTCPLPKFYSLEKEKLSFLLEYLIELLNITTSFPLSNMENLLIG